MSKINGKPVSSAEVTLKPRYDMEAGEEVPLPKKREKVYWKFTEENRRKILLIFKGGMSTETAAGACRISPNTIRHWLEIGEKAPDEAIGVEGELREFYLDSLEAKSSGKMGFRSQLQEFAKTDPKVLMWLSERLYPEEFSKPSTQVTHTGKDGGPIQITAKPNFSNIPDEDLDHLIKIREKYSTADVIDVEDLNEKGNDTTKDRE